MFRRVPFHISDVTFEMIVIPRSRSWSLALPT